MPGRQKQSLMREVADKAEVLNSDSALLFALTRTESSLAGVSYTLGVLDALHWASGASVPSDRLSDIMARPVGPQ